MSQVALVPDRSDSRAAGHSVVAAIERADLATSTKTKYLREVEKYLATARS